MKKNNVTEVQKLMDALEVLRGDVKADKKKVVREIEKIKEKLDLILDEEEDIYVKTFFPGADAVAVQDDKLNALFDAIGFLGDPMTYPKQIVENIDSAVKKLEICIRE